MGWDDDHHHRHDDTVAGMLKVHAPPTSFPPSTTQFHVDVSPACMDLVSRMLVPNPSDRISINDVLKHPWYMRNLPQELRTINRRLSSMVPSSVQTEDEIRRVMTIAQEVDPQLMAGFNQAQMGGFP